MEIRINWNIKAGSFEEAAMMIAEYDIFQLSLRYRDDIPGYTAEDIAQELRFHLWRFLPSYNPKGPAGLRTWTRKALMRKIYNLRRDSCRIKRKIHHNTCSFDDDRNETGCIIGDEEQLREQNS